MATRTLNREPKSKKVKALQALKEKLQKAKATIITDYRGMTVLEISELRKKLKSRQIDYAVVKNTLFLRAAQEVGIKGFEQHVTGPLAVAFGTGDAVLPAKIILEYFEEIEKPKVKIGYIENKLADEKLIAALAKLPTREVLIAKVVGGIKSPLQGLVMVLSGVPRKLVYVLSAIQKQKETKQ
jgi:large subunit ribosomal protein L10